MNPHATQQAPAPAQAIQWRRWLMGLAVASTLITILGWYAAPDFMRNVSNLLYSCF